MRRVLKRLAWSRDIYLLGLLTPAVAAVTVILSVPIAWLVRISLYPQDQSYDLSGWPAVHYIKALTDDLYLESLARTTLYSLIVTLGTAILGFPLGYAAARGRLRRWKLFFIVLPLTLSLVVNIFGWIMILGQNGLLNSVLLSLGVLDRPRQFLFG